MVRGFIPIQAERVRGGTKWILLNRRESLESAGDIAQHNLNQETKTRFILSPGNEPASLNTALRMMHGQFDRRKAFELPFQ